jgi:hypothetical protein
MIKLNIMYNRDNIKSSLPSIPLIIKLYASKTGLEKNNTEGE